MAPTKCNRNDESNAWFWILWWTQLLFGKSLFLFDIILSRFWISLLCFVSFRKLQILEHFRDYDSSLLSTCWYIHFLVGTSRFCWYNGSNGFRQSFLKNLIFKILWSNNDKHSRVFFYTFKVVTVVQKVGIKWSTLGYNHSEISRDSNNYKTFGHRICTIWYYNCGCCFPRKRTTCSWFKWKNYKNNEKFLGETFIIFL